MKNSVTAILSTFILLTSSLLAQESQIKEHIETITESDRTFEIVVDGTINPENIEIVIENIGDQPVVNPRVTVNGKYDWSTVEKMVAEITSGCTTDKEKAMAVFSFVEENTYWWTYPKDLTHQNPVRHFNSYGYHICSTAASMFVALCRAAGVEARNYEIGHHSVAEAKWDGAWHHMDADIGVWYLNADNKTIASMKELEENPELVARSYKPYRWYPDLQSGRKRIYKIGGELAGGLANLYKSADNNWISDGYDKWVYVGHNMNYTLRPCEKLERWWKPVLRKYYDRKSTHEPPRYANGRLTFEPDFSRFKYEGMIGRKNIKLFLEDGQMPFVHVDRRQDALYDYSSSLSVAMKSPYVIVGGYVDTRYYKGGTDGRNKIALSAGLDPTFEWTSQQLWDYYSWGVGMGECRADLDDKLVRDGRNATYGFNVIYSIQADSELADQPAEYPLIYGTQSGLDNVIVVAELQVNPGSLPKLSLGRNVIQYSDECETSRKVRVSYKWREIADQHAPEAAELVSPGNFSTIQGLTPGFKWREAEDADGDKIVCYRFQLSLRPECTWPLCASFDRDVRDGTSFQAPNGWLNPKTTYYWRVMAEDANGYTGPWSSIYSFTTP